MAAASKNTTPSFSHLLPAEAVATLVRSWLHEDTPSFDFGGYVVGEGPGTAQLLCKSNGVVAGLPFVNAVFAELGCTVTWHVVEGTLLAPAGKQCVATVAGPTRALLRGERVALNVLARCSGVASASRKWADVKARHGWHGAIAGTRKTTPGFRLVEKYGMLVGGVDTHRLDLSSMVMLKDNHVWSTGSIPAAVSAARRAAGFAIKVEVEARNQAEAEEAIGAGADVVMLDNMAPEELKSCAAALREKFPRSHVLLEASGGITLDTVEQFFSPHIDVLSTSQVHQGVATVDFSLKLDH